MYQSKIVCKALSTTRRNCKMDTPDNLDSAEIDLMIIAVENIDSQILLKQEKLFETYLIEDDKGFLGLECFLSMGTLI